jgi:hypothetical protein
VYQEERKTLKRCLRRADRDRAKSRFVGDEGSAAGRSGSGGWGIGAGGFCSSRRANEKEKKSEPVRWHAEYYAIWWEGKTVLRKSVDETFWQKTEEVSLFYIVEIVRF